eukprot:4873977-Prymnesium_polylepis.2
MASDRVAGCVGVLAVCVSALVACVGCACAALAARCGVRGHIYDTELSRCAGLSLAARVRCSACRCSVCDSRLAATRCTWTKNTIRHSCWSAL